MPNKPAPLTAEEITTAKCLMSGCNSAPWHSAGTIVRNEDDQDICVIEERFQWNPGHGKRPTCDVVADAQAIAEARNNYPRAIATIEQQRKQIAALEKERPMWLNAIKIALSGEVAFIGEPGKSNVVREALEPVDLLMKERDGLKAELERQWSSEHNEYCQSDYPHDGICHVPKPKYLEASCPR